MSAPHLIPVSSIEPERVLFLGDTHGNLDSCAAAIQFAKRQSCDAVVQVGDFGYWEHLPEGVEFLDALDAKLSAAGLVLYFVDGNHENHEMLRSQYGPNEDGWTHVRSHIVYLPRGHRWVWRGWRFLALGGAFSIDRRRRIKYHSWWPEEEITEAEVQAAISGGPVDVMVTHDVPSGADIGPILPVEETELGREKLTRVVEAVQPEIVIHGHYHRRVRSYVPAVPHCRTVGLDADGSGSKQWLVVDLRTDPHDW